MLSLRKQQLWDDTNLYLSQAISPTAQSYPGCEIHHLTILNCEAWAAGKAGPLLFCWPLQPVNAPEMWVSLASRTSTANCKAVAGIDGDGQDGSRKDLFELNLKT